MFPLVKLLSKTNPAASYLTRLEILMMFLHRTLRRPSHPTVLAFWNRAIQQEDGGRARRPGINPVLVVLSPSNHNPGAGMA